MPRLAIIADDLTGALDAAAPFAAVAGGVVVATRPDALGEALESGAGVVAVSTRSREIAPAAAQDRVAAVLAALPAGTRVFKKVDSRLKGNVADELAAFGDRPLLAAPAIPEFGRCVRDGMLEGFGVDAPIAIRAALGPSAERAFVPDVLAPADFAAALAATGPDTVLLGARGLAVALATAFGLAPPPALGTGGLARPLVMAVGSTDPITMAQVRRLRRDLDALAYVSAPGGQVPPPHAIARRAMVTIIRAAQHTGARPPAAEVAARFAAGVAPWMADARAIVLTGGATAEAVFDALGETRITVAGEALPGMPLAIVGGRQAVTKSGGFGAPDCLLRLAGALAPAVPA